MSPRLRDLPSSCFEGVIPSVIATAAADGTPNVSYLSHVVRADEDHVALSNQFFGKTVANLRANPQAAILLVDARTAEQFRIDALYAETVETGAIFDRIAAQLAATSAQVGHEGLMRLRAVDIFRVTRIFLPSTGRVEVPDGVTAPDLPRVAQAARLVADATDAGGIVDGLLDGLCRDLAVEAALLLLQDHPREVLATVGSRGYGRQGVGSEVPFGQGVIGRAAADRRPVRVNDLSRIRRFAGAIRSSSEEEDRTREIALPGLAHAASQVAVPLVAQGVLLGVLAAESPRRMAYGPEEEAAFVLLAQLAASALALVEARAAEPAVPPAPAPVEASGPSFQVAHHGFDDSVFIDDRYIIKGLAGRILVWLLDRHAAEARVDFSNREIRLAPDLRMPDFKDNLETRLLLLRRRLEERAAPVRLRRTGRGQIRLELDGAPRLVRHPS